MATLGRISADLNEERGPDVALEVRVPPAWFEEGAEIELTLPRLLSCARCDGGGCDACERAGAFSRDRLIEDSTLRVYLPAVAQLSTQALQLRLPGCGVRAEGVAAGHVLLTLRCDEQPSALVRRCSRSSRMGRVSVWLGMTVAATILLCWWLAR